MSDPTQSDEARRRRDQALAVARSGGGGHDGGMSELERRVGSLESKVDRIAVDLTAARVDLAELKGKVSQLPTVWTLMFANFGLAATVSALVFAIARSMK